MIEERAHALRQSAITLFPTEAARRCHPERARGTRASEGSAGARSFAPAALRITRLARFGARKRGEHHPMQDCARACPERHLLIDYDSFLPEPRGAVILSERAERARDRKSTRLNSSH